MEKKKETVTISKAEYETLKEDSLMLQCLVDAGVEDWEGYAFADKLFVEFKEE